MIYKIYSKPNCVWCVKAKELMNNLGIPYEELTLDIHYTRDELRALVTENIPLTTPQIFCYNKRIGGYEDLLDYLEQHNIMGVQN